jgi:annexin A7/11
MVSLCNAHRDESNFTDIGAASADAQALLDAGEAMWGTDESVFNNILCQRNFQQLRLVIQQYEEYSGNSLESAIKSEFSGDIQVNRLRVNALDWTKWLLVFFQTGLLAIIQCVLNPTEFFASRLYASMKGLGTNDKQLIRLVVTRCEVSLLKRVM